jgi:hypothetical protein
MMQENEMRELWCGNCGFIGSETCCSETNWKRCRMMSAPSEMQYTRDLLEVLLAYMKYSKGVHCKFGKDEFELWHRFVKEFHDDPVVIIERGKTEGWLE